MIATAGHVDHGKSTLVRALTGMEPDRWAEERRRGMTIDLGYAWTRLPSGTDLAFVDVPGHQRFATNMLAGVGPVPAALLVVAADEGWAAQTEEHVRALDALGVTRGLLAVTRSDLADPEPVITESQMHLQGTSLAGVTAVAVSGATGEGLPRLRAELDTLVDALPVPPPDVRVRLWIDRCFTIRGSGTVVTGTLAAGTVRQGDTLVAGDRLVTIRGVQCLGRPVMESSGVSRVALNLRGVAATEVRRGQALLTPLAWRLADQLDVRIRCEQLPAAHVVVHVGSAAVPARVRVLGRDRVPETPGVPEALTYARLQLDTPLPLEVGDRLLLRDPGRRRILGGAAVLDPAPPALRRRGAARARTEELRHEPAAPDAAREVQRRGAVSVVLLEQIGVAPPRDEVPSGAVRAGDWLVASSLWQRWQSALREAVGSLRAGLLDVGVARAELASALELPDAAILAALLGACPDLEEVSGRVRPRGAAATLRPDLAASVERLRSALADRPFAAPEQPRLAELGLAPRELGAAAAAGVILRLPGEVVLLPDAPQLALERLRDLPQPFTLSAARQALQTTRRVAVPLLEHLDRLRHTQRVDGDLRRIRG